MLISRGGVVIFNQDFGIRLTDRAAAGGFFGELAAIKAAFAAQ